jgi:hypothetical protein
MHPKAPTTLRKFPSDWAEIEYLYHKILYWFYQRQDRRRALRFAPRLWRVLAKADPEPDSVAILGASCRALLAELEGDLPVAIRYRKKEIELLRRLQQLNPPAEVMPGPDDISDRLDLLAILYWNKGDLAKAEQILEESKQLCESSGIKFDGKQLLADVRRERLGANGQRNGARKKMAR